MQIPTINFRNNGEKVRNDVIHDDLFDPISFAYVFNIFPKSKFWRFGLRFSKSSNISFNLNEENRHLDPEFKDLHLSVGSRTENGIWENPTRLELTQYYFGDPDLLSNRCEKYIESTPVQFGINYDKESKFLNVWYRSSGCPRYEAKIELSEYKYFKIFAWADAIDFDLDCVIEQMISEGEGENTIDTMLIEGAKSYSITSNFEDAIGAKELAGEMVGLMKNLKDPTGNMIGIFGQWGRGKTYFWNKMTEFIQEEEKKNLEDKKGIDATMLFETVEFHAWKYQDTPASWAYLYENLSDKYISGNIFRKSWRRLKLNLVRHGFLTLISFFVLLTLNIFVSFFVPFEDKINVVIDVITFLGGLLALIKMVWLFISYKPKAINLLNKYSQKVSFHKYLGLQAEIQKEVVYLMKAWIKERDINKKKILIFVDDVDRCDEEKIIGVIDSFKVMMEDQIIAQRVTVIMAIDERILKMAIKSKYFELVNINFKFDLDEERVGLELDVLATEYIDKLFISGIKLGNLSLTERQNVFDKITKGKINVNERKETPALSNKEETKVDHEIDRSEVSSGDFRTEWPGKRKVTKVVYADEKFEIEQAEYKQLLDALNKDKQTTPRSIKIFYYRYLLAKRIMKLRLIKGSFLYYQWHRPETDKSILPNLIIAFSYRGTRQEAVSKEKEGYAQISKVIQKEILGKSYKLDARLYYEILHIVEIVVPY